ncbi:YjdF family protein [Clostridium cadaveris]|uniref:YjdF family protein n=1 Tax=Clostridium cadaveris TaxID=1529 RepID=UPI000942192B|nr:YjdF family protein [Clostridium cadaveris]MDM8312239.1 YjdF family protein [Clostridium cadaveris]NME65502.1 YjdF family protein [Clostridium cadaveris]NWK11927.1 YjdF family protein [Clostridium cadaveris]
MKLTIFFEEPFWVGVFEEHEGKSYSVSKVTFGAEPKDEEIYEFILTKYNKLKFVGAIMEKENSYLIKKENPKRLQRKIKRETKEQGIGTKAQVALKEQYENNKLEKKKHTKLQRSIEESEKFKLKQSKRKEKHKGH